MKQCGKCGAFSEESSLFCKQCGAALLGTPTKATRKKGFRRGGLVALVILLCLVLAGGGAACVRWGLPYLMKEKNEHYYLLKTNRAEPGMKLVTFTPEEGIDGEELEEDYQLICERLLSCGFDRKPELAGREITIQLPKDSINGIDPFLFGVEGGLYLGSTLENRSEAGALLSPRCYEIERDMLISVSIEESETAKLFKALERSDFVKRNSTQLDAIRAKIQSEHISFLQCTITDEGAAVLEQVIEDTDYGGSMVAMLSQNGSHWLGSVIPVPDAPDHAFYLIPWDTESSMLTTLLQKIFTQETLYGTYYYDDSPFYWGCMNRGGEVIVEPSVYTGLGFLTEGKMTAKKDGLYGYLDRNGKEIVPFIYEEAFDFSDGFAQVKLDGKMGYINARGERIGECVYDDCKPFHDGYAGVMQGGLWGLMDSRGRLVIDFQYDNIGSYSAGVVAVEREGLWGGVDAKNRERIPFLYEWEFYFPDKAPAMVRKDEKFGYINNRGETVIPFVYDDAEPFSEGLAAVGQLEDGAKRGYINPKGEIVIPLQYTSADSFLEGFAAVGLQDENGYYFGYIDKTGEVTVPLEYIQVSGFYDGLDMVTDSEQKTYLINPKGERLLCMDGYGKINMDYGLFCVEQDGKRFYLDEKGEQVGPCYDFSYE